MHVERELKFRLDAASASSVWSLVPRPGPVRRRVLHSVYYDTADHRLRAARAALRLRRDGRRWLICFKHDDAPASGLAQRSEWEAAVARRALAVDALPLAEIRATAGIDLRALAPRLAPVFSTRFTRRASEIALAGGTRLELCVDGGNIAAGRRSAPIQELELELIAGDLAAMLDFAEQLVEPLRLELEPLSKAERGYRLAARERAAPVKGCWPPLRKRGSVETAMCAVLEACLAQVVANLYGVAHAADPEYLHQLRVGMRRIRSALRVFEGLGPRDVFRTAAAGLREFMPELGVARDWDVFCAQLREVAQVEQADAPQPARLLRSARTRRATARKAARALAGSPRMQRFLLGIMRWMLEARWRANGTIEHKPARSLTRFAGHALARQERRVLRLGSKADWTDASQRHRLRIRIKRLRYACEPFGALYGRARVRRYLERLETLQDILGELNDIAVGRRLLAELRSGRGDPQAEFMRGWFAAREGHLVAQLAGAWGVWRKTRSPW
jgi:triphosphatase